MKKINIQDWKEFKIEDLFELVKLNKLNSEDSRKFRTLEETDRNKVPAIVAKKGNNGVMYYVAKEDYETTSNKLVIIGDGAVASGLVYYHENEFTILHNAYAIDIKEKGEYSRYTFLFLKTIIQTMIYNQYGYEEKPTWNKVKLNRIYLPVDISGEPDWKYMESYIKQLYTRERESSYHVTTYLEKSKSHKINIEKWKEFQINNLFSIKRPSPRSVKKYNEGSIPFVSSGNYNNGVDSYRTPLSNESLEMGNCITVSPVDGSTFYQPSDFLGRGGAGSSILLLYNDKLNKYTGLFLSAVIRGVLTRKYQYNDMGSSESIKLEYIKLPVNKKNELDWQYMEEYMKKLETSMKNMIETNNNFINVS